MAQHGTAQGTGNTTKGKRYKLRGELHPQAKLTSQQAKDIQTKFGTGRSVASLSREYSMSETAISRVVRRQGGWGEI